MATVPHFPPHSSVSNSRGSPVLFQLMGPHRLPGVLLYSTRQLRAHSSPSSLETVTGTIFFFFNRERPYYFPPSPLKNSWKCNCGIHLKSHFLQSPQLDAVLALYLISNYS